MKSESIITVVKKVEKPCDVNEPLMKWVYKVNGKKYASPAFKELIKYHAFSIN
jgi:hypothetical protein